MLKALLLAVVSTLVFSASAQAQYEDDANGVIGGLGSAEGWQPGWPNPQPPYPGHGGGHGGGHHGGGHGGGHNPGIERMVDVHRFFNGRDQLLTLNINEGYQVQYNYLGSFRTFAQNRPSRKPIFRCYIYLQSHFASNDYNCEGFINEGILGYAEQNPTHKARRQVVRCYNGATHFVSTDQWECQRAGYWVEGPLGYVP